MLNDLLGLFDAAMVAASPQHAKFDGRELLYRRSRRSQGVLVVVIPDERECYAPGLFLRRIQEHDGIVFLRACSSHIAGPSVCLLEPSREARSL